MQKLAPIIPPPPSDLLTCLPANAPAAARQRVETLVAEWRRLVADQGAAVAEVHRLAKLPQDLDAATLLAARDAAVADAEAAAVAYLQMLPQLAAAYAECKPVAREDARAARLAVERRRGEVAIATRQADLLASDKAVEDALAADSKLSDLRAAAGQAEWRLKTIERYEAPGNGGRIGLWCRDRLAVEVPA